MTASFPSTVSMPATARPADASGPPAVPRPSIYRENAYRISALLMVSDWLAAWLAIFVGLQVREWQRGRLAWWDFSPQLLLWSLAGAFAFGWIMVLLKTYERPNLYRMRRWALNLVKAITLWSMIMWAYIGLFPGVEFSPRIGVAYCAAALLGTLTLWRMVSFIMLIDPRVKESASSRVIVVGWNPKADHLRAALRRNLAELSEIIGCVPLPGGQFASRPPTDLALLGEYDSLATVAAECGANSILLAESSCDPRLVRELAEFCQREMLNFQLVPEYFPALNSGLEIQVLSGVPLLGVSSLPLDRTTGRAIKRAMDIVGATLGLMLSAPLIVAFSVAVYLESPGPVIFRQTRMSRCGRTFTIYKIRSMGINAESGSGAVWCRRDDPRRLKVGTFMRKYNIDELPQFWNVLIGDMSLVGPRPEAAGEFVRGCLHGGEIPERVAPAELCRVNDHPGRGGQPERGAQSGAIFRGPEAGAIDAVGDDAQRRHRGGEHRGGGGAGEPLAHADDVQARARVEIGFHRPVVSGRVAAHGREAGEIGAIAAALPPAFAGGEVRAVSGQQPGIVQGDHGRRPRGEAREQAQVEVCVMIKTMEIVDVDEVGLPRQGGENPVGTGQGEILVTAPVCPCGARMGRLQQPSPAETSAARAAASAPAEQSCAGAAPPAVRTGQRQFRDGRVGRVHLRADEPVDMMTGALVTLRDASGDVGGSAAALAGGEQRDVHGRNQRSSSSAVQSPTSTRGSCQSSARGETVAARLAQAKPASL